MKASTAARDTAYPSRMKPRALTVAALVIALWGSAPATAQVVPAPRAPAQVADYVVGPQDILVITSFDQPELTGTFTVEIDGTFISPDRALQRWRDDASRG